MKPWIARTGAAAVGAVMVALTAAAPAQADGPGLGDIDTDVQDSYGNPVSDYLTLSLYGGGMNPADPQHVFAPLVQLLWSLYASGVQTQIVLLDWVLSLTWVDFFLSPLQALSNTAQVVMAELGLRPLLLLFLGALVGVLLLKGRTGAAGVELVIGATIAALAVGALSDPMAMIGGPNGAVTQAQSAGMDLARAVATDGESLTAGDTTQVRNGLTAALSDTMLRTPHQFINYGTNLDGHPCEDIYDATLGQADARLEMGECDSQLQDVADHPDAARVVTTARLFPAGFVFGLFGWVIAIMAIGAVLLAGWAGVKLTWDLVVGVVGNRSGIFRSAANLALSLCVVILTIAGVPAYMKLVAAVMSSAEGPAATLFRFDLATVMLLIGIIVFILARGRLKKSLQRMGERLARLGSSHRGGHQPATLPSPVQMGRQGLETADRLSNLASRMRRRRAPSLRPGPAPAPAPAPNPISVDSTMTPHRREPGSSLAPSSIRSTLPSSTGQGRRLLSGPGGPDNRKFSSSGGPSPQPSGDAGAAASQELASDRLKRRMKKGGSLVAQVGLTVGTGGASAVVSGGRAALVASHAGKTAKAARVASQISRGAQLARSTTARTPQNTALRDRLQRVLHRPSQNGADRVTDADTGREYQRIAAPSGGTEILRPVRDRDKPRESAGSARLRERLRASRGTR